jgi:hypothetical protein
MWDTAVSIFVNLAIGTPIERGGTDNANLSGALSATRKQSRTCNFYAGHTAGRISSNG